MLCRDTSYNNLPPLPRGSQCSKNTACAIITKLYCGKLEGKTFKSDVQRQHNLQYLQLLLNEEKQQVALTLLFHKLPQRNEKHVRMVRVWRNSRWIQEYKLVQKNKRFLKRVLFLPVQQLIVEKIGKVRTYSVSFNKIMKLCGIFNCNWRLQIFIFCWPCISVYLS
jgi:hypothetical protein